MKHFGFAASTVSVLLLAGVIVSAQAPAQTPPAGTPGQGRGAAGGGGAPQPFQNLQVFPKDVAAPQLLQAMQAFSTGLGVTCAHCHVFLGANNPMNDMVSDTKPQKNIARAMMRMTGTINQQIQAAVTQKPADQVARVLCVTCHRGQAIPQVPAAAPATGARGTGAPGAPPADAPAPGPGRANQ